ncbi:hypothetical protein A2356_03485 [Candidatus Nomurabacteria bacterium RIFOXYB1_FULL_39_16]|uniref:Uncharacterized protein n=2 Tax=Candidatus Nomuraibacteriota TaxID=1752729 RepID=A0A0G0QUS5_9BACT|nr:MAG: hypothetical protein UT78_C0001G0114 [Candidatus Nomurabacteria bacterium GW2011_GWF2_40_12]OGJ08856.1 MAG: hypothetical protein A2356_03485 [Candidatus Nomurabacteria bacterium RIFOXYB1_FULL_39_16]OGJ14927.1 MAG: hypothetical protein A2585_03445 [Candidatus Nomurabacteria bacterium RIFOXYD1_FULL_39_12]
MNAQEFIKKRLEDLKVTQKVGQFKSNKELADFIFKTLMSKKFRKFAVTPEYIPHIHEAIENNIKNNLPIKLLFPFGGYKLWRLEETPEADWAELFSMMYFAKWIKPISEAYSPGVEFDFSSDEIIVERMNNIPKADTDAYAKSFYMIIDFLKDYLPTNLKFSMTPVSSYYTPEEFEKDLKEKILLMEEELGGLPSLDDHHRRMVELNVHLKPGQDKDPLWREKTELLHQSYYTIPKRRAYNRAKEKIIVFCINMENCIPVGTTKTSIAKFWPGAGALKKVGDSFLEYVLSPSQLESNHFTKEETAIKGLDSKNFKSIRVID